jgi:hypothetical protein
MKHYFQPGREEFRRTLAGKMPALLVGGEAKPKTAPEALDLTNLRSCLAGMSEENWPKVRDELLARLAAEKPGLIVDAELASA